MQYRNIILVTNIQFKTRNFYNVHVLTKLLFDMCITVIIPLIDLSSTILKFSKKNR